MRTTMLANHPAQMGKVFKMCRAHIFRMVKKKKKKVEN